MSYTGVLEQDATTEQIKTAKKTVQIITEFDGQKYVDEFDGTKGLTVLTGNETHCTGKIVASPDRLLHFIDTLLDSLPPSALPMLLAARICKAETKAN